MCLSQYVPISQLHELQCRHLNESGGPSHNTVTMYFLTLRLAALFFQIPDSWAHPITILSPWQPMHNYAISHVIWLGVNTDQTAKLKRIFFFFPCCKILMSTSFPYLQVLLCWGLPCPPHPSPWSMGTFCPSAALPPPHWRPTGSGITMETG